MTPQFEMFGLTIREPMTMFTDYLVAAAAICFAFRLFNANDHGQHQYRRFWGVAFVFIGSGAMLGGTSHGFAAYLGDDAMTIVWKCTLYTIGLSMAFAVAGTIRPSITNTTWQWILHVGNIVGFFLFASQVVNNNSYLSAIVTTLCSLGVIASLQTVSWMATKAASAKWIVSGVIVSCIAAAVQRSGIDLHTHFNHNDLYHTVQLPGLYMLYRGASMLDGRDRTVTP